MSEKQYYKPIIIEIEVYGCRMNELSELQNKKK